MSKGFIAVFTLILLVTGAFSGIADAAGEQNNWTGFYMGLNAGAAFNDSHYYLSPGQSYTAEEKALLSESDKFDSISFIGGLQAGYNRQINNFVLGLETDINYLGMDESDRVNRAFEPSDPESGRYMRTVSQKLDYLGTLRARLGFTPANQWLFYTTGGLAYGRVSSKSHIEFDVPLTDIYRASRSANRTGWTVGGGIEYAVARNWSLKGEYLYVDFGSHSYEYENQGQCTEACTYTTDIKTRFNIFRLGINYRF